MADNNEEDGGAIISLQQWKGEQVAKKADEKTADDDNGSKVFEFTPEALRILDEIKEKSKAPTRKEAVAIALILSNAILEQADAVDAIVAKSGVRTRAEAVQMAIIRYNSMLDQQSEGFGQIVLVDDGEKKEE